MTTPSADTKKRSAEEIAQEVASTEELETALSLWLVKKQKIAELRETLKKEEKSLEEIEKRYPLIGNVKGLIRKTAHRTAAGATTAVDEELPTTTTTTTVSASPSKAKSTKQRLEQKMKEISDKSKKFRTDSGFQPSSHTAPPDLMEDTSKS